MTSPLVQSHWRVMGKDELAAYIRGVPAESAAAMLLDILKELSRAKEILEELHTERTVLYAEVASWREKAALSSQRGSGTGGKRRQRTLGKHDPSTISSDSSDSFNSSNMSSSGDGEAVLGFSPASGDHPSPRPRSHRSRKTRRSSHTAEESDGWTSPSQGLPAFLSLWSRAPSASPRGISSLFGRIRASDTEADIEPISGHGRVKGGRPRAHTAHVPREPSPSLLSRMKDAHRETATAPGTPNIGDQARISYPGTTDDEDESYPGTLPSHRSSRRAGGMGWTSTVGPSSPRAGVSSLERWTSGFLQSWRAALDDGDEHPPPVPPPGRSTTPPFHSLISSHGPGRSNAVTAMSAGSLPRPVFTPVGEGAIPRGEVKVLAPLAGKLLRQTSRTALTSPKAISPPPLDTSSLSPGIHPATGIPSSPRLNLDVSADDHPGLGLGLSPPHTHARVSVSRFHQHPPPAASSSLLGETVMENVHSVSLPKRSLSDLPASTGVYPGQEGPVAPKRTPSGGPIPRAISSIKPLAPVRMPSLSRLHRPTPLATLSEDSSHPTPPTPSTVFSEEGAGLGLGLSPGSSLPPLSASSYPILSPTLTSDMESEGDVPGAARHRSRPGRRLSHASLHSARWHDREGRVEAWESVLSSLSLHPDGEADLDACAPSIPSSVRDNFTALVHQGIPPSLRPQVWWRCSGAAASYEPGLYEEILRDTPVGLGKVEAGDRADRMMLALDTDLTRTLPSHPLFNGGNGPAIPRLRRILSAYIQSHPETGYCQGMNLIVATLLLVVPEESQAYGLFVHIVDHILPPGYFAPGLTAARADQRVHRALLDRLDPDLSGHFAEREVDVSAVTSGWFLTLFTDVLPLESVLRAWDILLTEGHISLHKLAIGLILQGRSRLFTRPDSAATYALLHRLPSRMDSKDRVDRWVQRVFMDGSPLAGVDAAWVRRMYDASLTAVQIEDVEAAKSVTAPPSRATSPLSYPNA